MPVRSSGRLSVPGGGCWVDVLHCAWGAAPARGALSVGTDSVFDMRQKCSPPRATGIGGVPGDRCGSLGEVRASVAATVALLPTAPGLLWQASGSEMGELLAEVDELAALAAGLRVAVTAAALERGEVASSQCANTAAWVAQHATSLANGPGAGQVAKLVEQTARKPILEGLVQIGVADGSRQVRRLRPALLAKYGLADELQRDQDRAAQLVALSYGRCSEDGTWEYRFTLDPEGKAVLEAAIGPLSAPWSPDGARDSRSPQQRRAQALTEVCRRVTAAAKAARPTVATRPRIPPVPTPPVATPPAQPARVTAQRD